MGAVFLAEDTRLHRKVALKVLPEETASDADRLTRFQREARAVAALNHPHIVTIHSVEEDGGIHFLTMELIEGSGLDHLLPPGGLPLAKVFDIGIALADALAAAHEKGIVHRDLKPANVMLTKDGRVKVLDFGLAKLAPEFAGAGAAVAGQVASEAPTAVAPRDRPLTDAGLVIGTVPYMSPEQVNGQTLDARTDIFSLGVVLYELATGRRPFAGNTKAETISAILRDSPRSVTETRQDAPRHLGRIIDHCLQKDPEARFQTAKDVRNELRALRKEVESGVAAVGHPPSAPGSTPVSTPASSPASGPAAAMGSTAPGATVGAAGPRPWIWAVAGAGLMLAIGAAFWLGGRRPDVTDRAEAPAAGTVVGTKSVGATTLTEVNSLAVLPFADMSPGKDQEYFSDGLTEELLNALAKIPDLKVAGRTSSFSFKGKNEDLRSIGERLGVVHILEGSVRRSGNRVRITAQLVKAADGFHLWSETYDRTMDDIFAVQDDIANAVTRALQVTLLGRGTEERQPKAEAYDLVLQARYVMQVNSVENIRRAREMLERALKVSPDYAPAWAEMGIVHSRESMRAVTIADRQRILTAERRAYTRALQLDPTLAIAHSRMANSHMAAWGFAEAARSTERALAASPNSPLVLGNAALVYASLGRVTDSVSLTERSLELDPMGLTQLSNLGSYYLVAGRLDDAEAMCRRAIAAQPEGAPGYLWLGQTLLVRGKAEEARPVLMQVVELLGLGDSVRLWVEALVEHTAGNEEASSRAAAEVERRFCAAEPLTCVEVRSWRGETDAAFGWLDKCLAARDAQLAEVKANVLLRPLHADPRWNALLKKIGLPVD